METVTQVDELMRSVIEVLEGNDWRSVVDSPVVSVNLAAMVKEGVAKSSNPSVVFDRIRKLLIQSGRLKSDVFDIGLKSHTKTINNAKVLQIIKAYKLAVAPIDIEQDEGWVVMLATWQGSSHPFEAATLEDAVFGWWGKYGQKEGQ